jgi:hypothetical protein
MAADPVLFKQVLNHFKNAWGTPSFTGATEIRKLYPTTKKWIQLRYAFNGFDWLIKRNFAVTPADLAPKSIKTIQNVADTIQAAYSKASKSAKPTKNATDKVAALMQTLKSIA